MGFSNNSNTMFMNLSNGKFRMKVDAGTEGAIERENKNGKIVHELVFDTYTGYIIDMLIKEGEYGDSLNLSVYDGQDHHVITMGITSPYFQQFATRSNNIDFEKLVLLRAWRNESKDRSGLYIEQDGKSIDNFFIKYIDKEAGKFEYINGYPVFDGNPEKDKREYDVYKLERNNFLLKVLDKEIKDKILTAAKKTVDERDLPKSDTDSAESVNEGGLQSAPVNKKDKLNAAVNEGDDLPF